MKSTQNLHNIELGRDRLLTAHPEIAPLVERITKASGTAYLVGGAVRDLAMNIEVHDIDIEVHGLTLDQLADILKTEGEVSYVGKSFGVLKLHGTKTDWSLPRTDTSGRKPEVHIDPQMGITQALRRRDLTMNAMALNLYTGEFVDPFHGLEDIKNKTLRSPDIQFFSEDPLRFYRVMQFVGRFEMYPDQALEEHCKKMDIAKVSIERIEYEFEKLLLKSRRPSLGLRWLSKIKRLHEVLPELAHTQHTEQEEYWHPEGNVLEHSMQALDAAALIDKKDKEQNLILRYAALCHDLGKVSATITEDGRIKSPGHAQAGVVHTLSMLKRITRNVRLMKTVSLLVKYHMLPAQFIDLKAKPPAYKRLASKLAPYTNLEMLADLVLADRRGRNPEGHEPLTITPEFIALFLLRADEAQARLKPEEPILHGRDIKDLVEPGPEMGRLLDYALEVQIEQGIKDKDELKKLVSDHMKQ